MILAFLATLAAPQAAAVAALPSTTEEAQAGPVQPIPAPTGRLDASLKGLGLELEVNNDKPELSLSIARQLRPTLKAGGSDGRTAFFRQTSLSASATSPIGGKDDLVDPQTLDKLSVGPTVALGISQFRTSSRDEADGPKPAHGLQFGTEATFGFNRFDYRELDTLAKRSSDKFQYSIAAFAAIFPTGPTWDELTVANVRLRDQAAAAAEAERDRARRSRVRGSNWAGPKYSVPRDPYAMQVVDRDIAGDIELARVMKQALRSDLPITSATPDDLDVSAVARSPC